MARGPTADDNGNRQLTNVNRRPGVESTDALRLASHEELRTGWAVVYGQWDDYGRLR